MLHVIMIFSFCSNTSIKDDKTKCKTYLIDKKEIGEKLKKWGQNNKRWFLKEDFFQDTINLSIPNYFIDTILYASDCNRFFSIILFKADTLLLDSIDREMFSFEEKYFYGGRALLGYREKINSKWKIRHFEQFIGGCYTNISNARTAMRKAYFEDLHEKYFATQDSKNKRILEPIGYNVIEEEFWNSQIWDSVTYKKGYYPFELNNIGEPINQFDE